MVGLQHLGVEPLVSTGTIFEVLLDQGKVLFGVDQKHVAEGH